MESHTEPARPNPAPSCHIRRFAWPDWPALWQLRREQLAEDGIVIDSPLPAAPDLDSPYEPDYHRIESVYLAGRGGFWIAWLGDHPVGHVGGEDRGQHIELRRMYVGANHRRRGIGRQLVQALIDHCSAEGVPAVELWTAPDGPGRLLYETLGFFRIAAPHGERDGEEDDPEMRMRLDVAELRQ